VQDFTGDEAACPKMASEPDPEPARVPDTRALDSIFSFGVHIMVQDIQ
jgi:hypothetical protein